MTNNATFCLTVADTLPTPLISLTELWNQMTMRPLAIASSYQIVFAALTMNQTNVGSKYVQQFLDELLHIVWTDFTHLPANETHVDSFTTDGLIKKTNPY